MKHLGDVGAGHVLGRYELLMPIASGGMATVWAARLKGTRGFQKIVAIKTILPALSDDPQFEQMFLDEASLASRIKHPHVVEILDLGEQDGVLFLVMDWVDGEPLSVVFKAASKQGGIPLPITVRIISQACAGLHAAHDLRDESGHLLGLVHRDASPQNILVTFDGVVKVVDFGVAKAMGRASPDTGAGHIKGKASYMAPEQVRGVLLDRRTDVFALGILLYVMTTGRHPYRSDSDISTLYNVASETPVEPPSRFISRYPPSLEAVVMKALEKDRNRRFATANELQRALDLALPTSQWISTDLEVAAFMRQLLGDRHEQRRKALNTALRLADERAQGRTSSSIVLSEMDAVSHSGFTPPSNVSSLLPARELRSSYPTSRYPELDTSPPSSESGAGLNAKTKWTWSSLALRTIGESRLALLAIGFGLIVGVGVYEVRKPRTPRPEAQPPSTSAADPPATPLAGAPVDATIAPLVPLDNVTETAPDAESPPVRAKANSRASSPRATSKVPPVSSAPPKPSSTSFVPPVRNPGF